MRKDLKITLDGQINFDNLLLTYINIDNEIEEDWNNSTDEERKEFIQNALLQDSYYIMEKLANKLMEVVKLSNE